ncbi:MULTISPECIES: hypothetical protein [Diaphorobacter]|uniref:hypothetical protein n=1 Tax=Diaphorobacter TaxID=238749 RepID=UPI00289D5046|nr:MULTISPECIES: hypothetical protein [Diaphorobacter]
MTRISTDTEREELETVLLPRTLLLEISASAKAVGRSLEDHLVQLCLTGLACEAMFPGRAAGQRPQDLLNGLVALLKDPTESPALQETLRKNPVRVSMDPEHPQRARMTCADGRVVRGRLTDSGEFVADESDRES